MEKKWTIVLVAMVLFVIISAPFSVKADDGGWSLFECAGEKDGIAVYISYKKPDPHSMSGYKMKFINNNYYPVNLYIEVGIACESACDDAKSITRVFNQVSSSDSKIIVVNDSLCGLGGFISRIDGFRLEVRRSARR